MNIEHSFDCLYATACTNYQQGWSRTINSNGKMHRAHHSSTCQSTKLVPQLSSVPFTVHKVMRRKMKPCSLDIHHYGAYAAAAAQLSCIVNNEQALVEMQHKVTGHSQGTESRDWVTEQSRETVDIPRTDMNRGTQQTDTCIMPVQRYCSDI